MNILKQELYIQYFGTTSNNMNTISKFIGKTELKKITRF